MCINHYGCRSVANPFPFLRAPKPSISVHLVIPVHPHWPISIAFTVAQIVVIIIIPDTVRRQYHAFTPQLVPEYRNINLLNRYLVFQSHGGCQPGSMPDLHPRGLQTVGTKSTWVNEAQTGTSKLVHSYSLGTSVRQEISNGSKRTTS